MVERINRTILPVIATSMEDPRHKDWDKRIKEVERNLNCMKNKTTDKTPFEMLHGYVPRYNDGILRMLADEDREIWQEPDKIREDATTIIAENQTKKKQQYDKKRCDTIKFDPGQIVVVRRPPIFT